MTSFPMSLKDDGKELIERDSLLDFDLMSSLSFLLIHPNCFIELRALSILNLEVFKLPLFYLILFP